MQWNSVIQAFESCFSSTGGRAPTPINSASAGPQLARLLTFFLPLVGHAIYLYQSRPWKPATALFLLFWAGVFGLLVVGALALTPVVISGEYP